MHEEPLHLFQHHDQNAPLILNAQFILHAYKKNVKTHASQPNVGSMQNAKSTTTVLSVSVELAILEIPTISVKNVRSLKQHNCTLYLLYFFACKTKSMLFFI